MLFFFFFFLNFFYLFIFFYIFAVSLWKSRFFYRPPYAFLLLPPYTFLPLAIYPPFSLICLSRTRHGDVRQRSGAGLETSLLSCALPLTTHNITGATVSLYPQSYILYEKSCRIFLSLFPSYYRKKIYYIFCFVSLFYSCLLFRLFFLTSITWKNTKF